MYRSRHAYPRATGPTTLTHALVDLLRIGILLDLSLLYIPGARFTKYLTTILRLSYDNAKVTITYDDVIIKIFLKL